MKQRITIFLLLLSYGLSAQVIFVNKNAVGLNDGTSWLNAYVSLDAALQVAAGKEVWVAKGTYKPSVPAPNNTFLIIEGVSVYGGFAGTETSLSQRVIANNETILDGDILGNDVANDSLSRLDNALHVVTAINFGTSNDPAIIDGFTIIHGNTKIGSANSDLTRRGGGLIAGTKTYVRNCRFAMNTGDAGAALAALDAMSDGVVIENCIFENNRAYNSGIVFLRSTPTGLVKNCIFRNNTTNRGALYPSATTDLTIDSCLFENNNAGPNYGGGMFTWQATYTLSNCVFKNNVAGNAAGIYVDAREFTSSCTINNCTFEANTTTNYGGTGAFFNRGNYTMTGCSFINNTAPSSGAAIYHSADTKFLVKDCLIQGNSGNFAAAVANYGLGCVGTFENCMFKSNAASNGGGAVSNGFKADVLFKNCDFIENQANYGGAIFTQNDTTRLRIDGCYFGQNTASGSVGTAGAVLVNNNIAADIKNTIFDTNVADAGGAINVDGDSLCNISKCFFLGNIAGTQAAGLNFNSANALITNTVIAKNFVTGAGAGGGVLCNASDSTNSTVKMVNCTVADNFSLIGAEISQWEAPAGNAVLTLQNCLIQNSDGNTNYAIEEGDPSVISLGGNQSSDASMVIYLNGTKDQNNTTNTFVDPDNGNYAPTSDSPAGNGGVAAGAPVDDIEGTPRSMVPDVGAYEVNLVRTSNPNVQVLALQCAPNPATDFTVISFQHERNGGVQVSIWNQLGQNVASYMVEKTSDAFSFRINTASLAAGTYKVQVRQGTVLHEGTLVKF